MKKLEELIKRKDLISIKGTKTELGFTTDRNRLNDLQECEWWLSKSDKNGIRFTFENEIINFKNQ